VYRNDCHIHEHFDYPGPSTMLVILPDVQHELADFDLDPEVLPGLWRMEERHFWHAARNRWIARALERYGVAPPARLLDVGCGSGAVACALHQRGYAVVGIDTAEVLVRKAHERCPQATFVAGPVERLARDLGPFDAIGFFDVLEHLGEPEQLIRNALVHAKPGALVIATVPALMSLFSTVDELSGHKRRYELGELKQTFERCGLASVEEHGMFRLLRPLLRARRSQVPITDVESRRRVMLDDARVPWAPINGLLRLACSLEAQLGFARSKNRPGPTLLAVGRVAQ
jgi:SAM-dependent methyltransferase